MRKISAIVTIALGLLGAGAQAAEIPYGYWSLPDSSISPVTVGKNDQSEANDAKPIDVHYGYWSLPKSRVAPESGSTKEGKQTTQILGRMIGPGLFSSS